MKKWIRRLGLAFALLLVALAIFVVPTVWFKPWSINHFYMRVLVEAVMEDPLLLTQLRMFDALGYDPYADELPDMTMAAREKSRDQGHAQLAMLESYGTDGMTEDERLSYDVMHWLLKEWSEGSDRFLKHSYAYEQMQGLHVRFPDVMINYHQISGVRDAHNYIARVEKIAGALDDLSAMASQLAAEGFTIPNFILEKSAKDAAAFAAHPLEENPLRVDFRKKVEALGLSSPEKAELEKSMDQALTTAAIPGYQRFAAAGQDMATRTTTVAGVWHLPDGDAFYANRIADSTSTRMTADEIHRLGRAEVDRIQAEMNAITDSLGIQGGTFRERMERVAEDERLHWPDTDEGREQILAEYRRIIVEIEGGLDKIVQTDPKKPVAVERVPIFKEETGPGAYYFPEALDGSKPGTFYANLRDVRAHDKHLMRTLAYHEAVPGHHYQGSVARAQEDLPLVRRMLPMTAYSEGWALYAEQLAAEHGYQDDPHDRLGYLGAQLFRAVRLVVDTGIHSKRWSRQRAVDYMFANTAQPLSDVQAEIDRYCVWPGQALGYMVGRLKLLALREKAKRALGDRYDERELHDVFLLQGALPLDLLEKQVDRFIEKKKG